MCDLPSWFFALPDWVRTFMFSDFCADRPISLLEERETFD